MINATPHPELLPVYRRAIAFLAFILEHPEAAELDELLFGRGMTEQALRAGRAVHARAIEPETLNTLLTRWEVRLSRLAAPDHNWN